MAQAAASTGATRSRPRAMGSSGQRRRVEDQGGGHGEDEASEGGQTPCQTATICAGVWP